MRFNLFLLTLTASTLVVASITPSTPESSSSSSSSILQPSETSLTRDIPSEISEEVQGLEMILGNRSHERKTSYKNKHKAHKQSSSKKNGARTTYYAGNQLNDPACGGKTPGDDDMVGAVVKDGGYAKCGDKITIEANGKQVTFTVVDYCAGCPSP